MSMPSSFLKYEHSDIHFLEFGKGNSIVIALHGYGESAGSFFFLEKYITGDHHIVAIDLPFHGGTKWNEERTITSADMACIIDEILKGLGITSTSFILIGYSMGGRLALSLTENYPEKVSRLLLFAPDGMKVNFWYWIATQTGAGISLFRFTVKNPGWFFRLLSVANRFKLINKSIYKFVFTYVSDELVRKELFHRWTCMRKFKPDLRKIRRIIKEKKLPVRLLYGKYDRIILSKRARHLLDGLEEYCQLIIIEDGHQVLQQRHAALITSLLKS